MVMAVQKNYRIRIRELREDHDLTQTKIAEILPRVGGLYFGLEQQEIG